MSKILVVHASKGGNTKRLAEALAVGAREIGAEATVQSVQETTIEDLVAADGIAAGSPVYFGSMSSEMKSFWDRSVTVREKLVNKVGAAFVTSGHLAGGRETALLSLLQAMLMHEMVVIGDPIQHGGHYGVSCVGTPTEEDLDAASALGRKLAQVASRMCVS